MEALEICRLCGHAKPIEKVHYNQRTGVRICDSCRAVDFCRRHPETRKRRQKKWRERHPKEWMRLVRQWRRDHPKQRNVSRKRNYAKGRSARHIRNRYQRWTPDEIGKILDPDRQPDRDLGANIGRSPQSIQIARCRYLKSLRDSR
jgi:ribosome-binding protein aMBF1 (putative translation factor)